VAQLDGLGFAWELPDEKQARWEDMYGQLAAFREKHGHVRVPSSYTLNKPLAKWVARQREQGPAMPPERKARLEALGFLWKEDLEALDEEAWQEKYDQLRAFYGEHGHFRVPAGQKQYRSLRIWVDHQRKGQQSLPPERHRQLDQIGFPWGNDLVKQQEDAWQQMYAKLAAFQARFGHVRVPSKWKEDPALGAWVTRQRRRKDALPPAQRAQLDALGFAWPEHISRSKQQRWLKSYRELKAFKEKYGHCRVPDQYEANPALGKWVSWQRKQEREGKLPPGRKNYWPRSASPGPIRCNGNRACAGNGCTCGSSGSTRRTATRRCPKAGATTPSWPSGFRCCASTKNASPTSSGPGSTNWPSPGSGPCGTNGKRSGNRCSRSCWPLYREKGHCRVTVSHPDQKFFRMGSQTTPRPEQTAPAPVRQARRPGFSWKEDQQKLKEGEVGLDVRPVVGIQGTLRALPRTDRWPKT
jgi:hypothetical protein